MEDIKLLTVGAIAILLHLIVNVHLSKDILLWVPSLRKRILLLAIVWFIPVVGATVAYRSLNLSWFKKTSKKSGCEQSMTSGAFLEVDAIFNPGQRHVIEAKQKEHVELKEEGDMYNNGQPDLSNTNLAK